jgi:hypothetical protein
VHDGTSRRRLVGRLRGDGGRDVAPSLPLLAGDLYVELVAAASAYAATWVIVHHGTRPETEEGAR